MSDLVSIIMPSYNTAQYITETIQSVIDQTCIYPIVKILYRFRHLLKRLDGNKLIHAINTVLQMEEIARM